LFDGASQIVESLLALSIHVVKHVVLKAALQKVIRERAEQIFHAHLAGRVRHVFAVTDAFHNESSRQSSVVSKPNSLLTTEDRRLTT